MSDCAPEFLLGHSTGAVLVPLSKQVDHPHRIVVQLDDELRLCVRHYGAAAALAFAAAPGRTQRAGETPYFETVNPYGA